MAEQNLTQAKLAKKLGIGAPKLSQILKERRELPAITSAKYAGAARSKKQR